MTTNAQTFIVSDADQGQRLDRFLSDRLPDLSREKIKKAVQSGDCTVDMRRVSVPKSRVLTGQHVCLEQPEGGEECVRAEEGAIDCLWHDEHLALLHKPAGLTVHPCPSCPEGTLVHRLVGYFPQLHQQEGLRPGIVHRLDKDTSGLILIALTEAVRLRMSEAFAEREVHKEYLALVHGVPPEEGDVDEPLGRHPSIKVKMAVVPEEQGGRPALSHWQRVYADPEGRLPCCVYAFLRDGRTKYGCTWPTRAILCGGIRCTARVFPQAITRPPVKCCMRGNWLSPIRSVARKWSSNARPLRILSTVFSV